MEKPRKEWGEIVTTDQFVHLAKTEKSSFYFNLGYCPSDHEIAHYGTCYDEERGAKYKSNQILIIFADQHKAENNGLFLKKRWSKL